VALERLFTVDEVYDIEGRGSVVCGFSLEQYGELRQGMNISLRRPDGSSIATFISDVEYPPSIIWLGKKPDDATYGVLWGRSISKDDFPIGTEVWTGEL
jgi:hypothetical protein